MAIRLKREPNRILELHCEIGLTKGNIAIVDFVDFEYLTQFDWVCHVSTQKRAVRYIGRKTIYMHIDVLRRKGEAVDDIELEADHINRNTLDNRRDNLRMVTHYVNMRNTARHEKRVGVMLHKASGL